MGEELESIIPSYAFIDLVYDSYAEAPVWSPTISNPLLGDGQVTRETASSVAPQGTTPKMPAGGHRRPRPEGNVETQTRLQAQPCDSAPQNGLAHLPRPAPTAARPPPSPWATSPSEPRSGTVLVDAQTRGTSGPRGRPGLQLQGGVRGRGWDPSGPGVAVTQATFCVKQAFVCWPRIISIPSWYPEFQRFPAGARPALNCAYLFFK